MDRLHPWNTSTEKSVASAPAAWGLTRWGSGGPRNRWAPLLLPRPVTVSRCLPRRRLWRMQDANPGVHIAAYVM